MSEGEANPLIVIIDDYIGQGESNVGAGGRTFFDSVSERTGWDFAFISGLNPFLNRYRLEDIQASVAKLPRKPSLFLVDLVFGEPSETAESEHHLGLHVLMWLADPRSGQDETPRALLTTVAADQRAHHPAARQSGSGLIQDVLDQTGAGYLDKKDAFSNDFVAAVSALLQARRA